MHLVCCVDLFIVTKSHYVVSRDIICANVRLYTREK